MGSLIASKRQKRQFRFPEQSSAIDLYRVQEGALLQGIENIPTYRPWGAFIISASFHDGRTNTKLEEVGIKREGEYFLLLKVLIFNGRLVG